MVNKPCEELVAGMPVTLHIVPLPPSLHVGNHGYMYMYIDNCGYMYVMSLATSSASPAVSLQCAGTHAMYM